MERKLKRALQISASFVSLAFIMMAGCGDPLSIVKGVTSRALTDITGFTMPGIIGSAVIDATNNTVTATVQPMDISAVTPTVTVPQGATVTMSALKDGVAVPYTVTSKDGNAVTWNVTVTVSFGIVFNYGLYQVMYTHGVVDSSSATNTVTYGSDTPGGVYVSTSSGSQLWAMKDTYDIYAMAGQQPPAYVMLIVPGNAQTGTFNSANSVFTYQDTSGSINVQTYASLSFTITVVKFGAVGGSIIGSFYGLVQDSSGPGQHQISGGFFKMKRLADDIHLGP